MAEQAHSQNEKSALKKSSQKPAPGKQGAVGRAQSVLALQRAQVAPTALTAADVLTLQRTVGNRATGLLLQAKLKLGPAGDRYEQEADSTARQVVRSMPPVQRDQDDNLAAQPGPAAVSVQASRYAGSIADMQRNIKPSLRRGFVAPQVQRGAESGESALVQAKPNHGLEGGDVETDVARSIESAKGGGQPLDDNVRGKMEQGFGASFGGVRIHTGGQADALNRSLNARAFTTGNDIFFGKGEYNPGSSGGQELLAHELTHTVQQRAAPLQRETDGRTATTSQNNIQRAIDTDLGEFAAAPYPDILPDAPTSSPASDGVIQRVWHTCPLDYATMAQEKNQGQIRTKALKIGGGLSDWVRKFHAALAKRKDRDALKALEGLKTRLEADQQIAAKGNLKAPKGVDNFNKVTAQENAATFFLKWIPSVQEHIDYANTTGDWMTDFREKYVNEPAAATLTPREAVLRNLENVDNATDERLQGIGRMWDLGNQAMQQRMTDLMGGVSDLPRMSSLEYFLEQVSPVHVGYGRVLAMFDMWKLGVLSHNWTHPWETWMPTKSDDATFGNERIVDSYDPVTRAQYQLTLHGKQIRKADDNPLVGDNIYVLTRDNIWYGGAKDGPVHHSSFMQGAPVKCAGHLHTDHSGNLTRIDTNSGHYAPDVTALRRAATVLKTQMDVSDVQVSNFGGGGLQSVDNFLRR